MGQRRLFISALRALRWQNCTPWSFFVFANGPDCKGRLAAPCPCLPTPQGHLGLAAAFLPPQGHLGLEVSLLSCLRSATWVLSPSRTAKEKYKKRTPQGHLGLAAAFEKRPRSAWYGLVGDDTCPREERAGGAPTVLFSFLQGEVLGVWACVE